MVLQPQRSSFFIFALDTEGQFVKFGRFVLPHKIDRDLGFLRGYKDIKDISLNDDDNEKEDNNNKDNNDHKGI